MIYGKSSSKHGDFVTSAAFAFDLSASFRVISGMKKSCLVPLLILLTVTFGFVLADEPKDVSVEKAAELLAEDPAITVLDVRTPEEFAEGHLKDAVNLDFNADDFEQKIAKLDPAKPYLVHCAAGGRSGQSMELFEKHKFTRILHLSDGYRAWVEAGKPVEK